MASTATSELPEPLRTAVNGVADMMAMNSAGTSGKGGTPHNYRRLAEQHREAVLALLRERVESKGGGRTVRVADDSVYKDRPPRSVLFRVVICDASRPDRPVSVLRSTDGLYIITAPNSNGPGLVVSKAAAKGM